VYEDEALARAKEIDEKLKNGTAGKLAGLVVGLKDVISYKGHPLQAGSKILDSYISPYNATVVERLLKEDAIIIGRQNCDEFAMGSSNENSSFGPVLNPVNAECVPGGSSGGSAVAVASDMCQVALGSDTGGSVRQPAAFCGVVGLKPTYSRISRHGLIAYGSSFDCIGILAKNVEDISLVLSVIAGQDQFDSTVSHKPVPEYFSMLRTKKKFKICCISNINESPTLQTEIKVALNKSIKQLIDSNHEIHYSDLPLLEYVLPTYYILATAEASCNLSRFDGVRYGYRSSNTKDIMSMYFKTRSEGFGAEVKRRILLGTFVLSSDYYDSYYLKAQKVRQLIRNQVKELLKDYDFILMPTTTTTAFKLGEHNTNPLEMYLSDLYSVQANVAGLPAVSFPYGKDDTGLPIGLQLLADEDEETKLFQLTNQLIET